MINLHDVYDGMDQPTLKFLYDLLRERGPEINISHRDLPTWKQHVSFVQSVPYDHWYIVENPGYVDHRVGAVYLTSRNEIGIFIRSLYRGNGYGPAAIKAIMAKHPRPEFLANINPANARSIRMFEKMGFGHIQNTYRLEAS